VILARKSLENLRTRKTGIRTANDLRNGKKKTPHGTGGDRKGGSRPRPPKGLSAEQGPGELTENLKKKKNRGSVLILPKKGKKKTPGGRECRPGETQGNAKVSNR